MPRPDPSKRVSVRPKSWYTAWELHTEHGFDVLCCEDKLRKMLDGLIVGNSALGASARDIQVRAKRDECDEWGYPRPGPYKTVHQFRFASKRWAKRIRETLKLGDAIRMLADWETVTLLCDCERDRWRRTSGYDYY